MIANSDTLLLMENTAMESPPPAVTALLSEVPRGKPDADGRVGRFVAFAFFADHSEELVKLDEALQSLSKLDARQSGIVELSFCGGVNVDESTQFLGISRRLGNAIGQWQRYGCTAN